MKMSINKWMGFVAGVMAVVSISSCNKDLPDAQPITAPPTTGLSVLEFIRANGNLYSYLDSAIARASTYNNPSGKLDALLGDKSKVITFFAPDDDAFKRSFQALGLPISVSSLKGFTPAQLDGILRYHIIGGLKYETTAIPTAFPNAYLESALQLSAASPAAPAYTMPIFPGKQGQVNYINNVQLIPTPNADPLANGILHRATFVLLPPDKVLWQRIAADPDLTYLKAAVEKADEGDPAKTLQSALSNPAANFTVFAPTNAAFQQLLTGQITLALMGLGLDAATAAAQAGALASTPGVFTNPALAGVLTPTTVKGIVVYHILTALKGGAVQGVRAFSVNIPTDEISSLTLLNSAIAAHPGVKLKTIYGFSGVIAIAVKGLGNATASNAAINPTPGTGSSDQHYVNGVLHKIDQVLLPQ